MSKGRIWKPEWRDYDDPITGVHVRQLTDYKGHSNHLYFTNPGWYDSGRRLLFGSDRENRTNFFSLDFESGEITQLTDLEPPSGRGVVAVLTACVNPVRDEAYFVYGTELCALDLHSLKMRELWALPDGFRHTMVNCTADGNYVCMGVSEDLSDRVKIEDHKRFVTGYGGFRETFELNPHSMIMKVSTDGTCARTAWEEDYWIGHVNTSPTQPDILTFCHEGPWSMVDNRIWGMDLRTCKPWRIRPRSEPGERVGHEYWYADGLHLGYHGTWPDGRFYFGTIRYDNTERKEVDFSHQTGHIHSNDFNLIVGDGGWQVRLWKWNGSRFDGPRMLCAHRSSFHIQRVHAHPRFTVDGKRVLFTSDTSGYGNLYLADVAEFDTLPEIGEED